MSMKTECRTDRRSARTWRTLTRAKMTDGSHTYQEERSGQAQATEFRKAGELLLHRGPSAASRGLPGANSGPEQAVVGCQSLAE